MSDPNALFARYLAQRRRIGEDDLSLLNPIELRRTKPEVESGRDVTIEPAAGPRAGSNKPSPARVSQGTGEKWRKGAPELPPEGIEVPAPETDLFKVDPLVGCDLDALGDLIRGCEKCELCRERTNAVPGEGPPDASLMVIGEGPGANEDAQGRPFVGRAGDLLNDILAAIDCPRETVYIANIVKCRPPGNRSPERGEIAQCLPYLHRQIALVKPDVILALGSVAACTLLETRAPLGALRNKVHNFRGVPLVVTYHPAALLRNPNWKKPTWDDVRIARRLLAGER